MTKKLKSKLKSKPTDILEPTQNKELRYEIILKPNGVKVFKYIKPK